MRGDPPANNRPGATAPTITQLLVGRLVTQIEDSGVTPKDVTQRAVAFFKAAVPNYPHPLYQGTVADYVVRAIYKRDAQGATLRLDNVNSFKQHIATDVEMALHVEGRGDEADEFEIGDAVDAVLNPYIARAEAALYTNEARMKSKELRNLMWSAAENNPNHRDLLEVAAERFIAAEGRPQLHEPTDQQKAMLSNALETLPSVKAMYRGKIEDLPAAGGLHLQSLKVRPKAEAQSHFKEHMEGFVDRISRGMTIYDALVEGPRRPPDSRVSNFEIKPDRVEVTGTFLKSTKVIPYRANASRERDKVRLSVMSEPKHVVHELGHQVEFHLPTAEWLDLQQILAMRHKGGKLQDIYGNGKEAAFNADMPAFAHKYGRAGGLYGAKVYSDGDTELISLTTEFFSEPETARTMIKEDPLVAATVLRAIRPEEFNLYVTPFLQDLLPRGSAALNADRIEI